MGITKEARETGFDFSADGLIGYVKEKFGRVIDNRNLPDVEISLEDALQAVYAMFALKSPSLLEFDKEINANSNIRSIFKLKRIPSDTQMRGNTR
jgi:ATP-dependent Clp protease ATP-binding subunit ClpA